MSSVLNDNEKAPAEDITDETPTSNSQEEPHKHSASARTSQMPNPNSQELEKYYTASDDTSQTPTPKSQELERHTKAEDDTPGDQTVLHSAPLSHVSLMLALCISIFLVSLDRTIITTVSHSQSLLLHTQC